MVHCEKQKAVGSRQKAENSSALVGAPRRHQAFLCLLLSAFCFLSTACRRDMQDQPKAIAYRENSFYKDGTVSPPLVEGTVPPGSLRAHLEFYLVKKPITPPPARPSLPPSTPP